ncbi:MAG: hypothetical protein IJQ18_08140 [Paludibacteraceae bacterium]|nr:hypothetical protein [Paludibacteraceae bacterium]
MKKIFLFAAAAIAALTVNAKVIDLTAVATTIADWTPGAQATLNAGESDEAKGKYVYDIAGGEEANVTTTTADADLEFQTKNTKAKTKAFAIYPGKCFEFGGKNGVLVIKNTKLGDAIKLTVAAKGSTAANFADATAAFPKNAYALSTDLTLPAKQAGAEGADEQGYIWKVLEFESLGGDVEIKEFDGGYRISQIQVGGTQGIDNVEAVKAEKFYRDGQLIIRKNGVEYNALGTKL